MIDHILLLCTANICRSPMAEAVFREAVARDGERRQVSSAGIHALVGHPIADDAQTVLERRGLDMSAHRARQVDQDRLRWADLVLVMENDHRSSLRSMAPAHSGKIFLLGHWLGAEVLDPYLHGLEAFEQTLKLIEQATAEWTTKLA